uniref:Putative tRNA threonylcarbamoyladenosine biosynthesis protein Gcp n=1 Tax=Lygus hesperus TaxID=30085 RepID=A0A0A9Y395_LYGHE
MLGVVEISLCPTNLYVSCDDVAVLHNAPTASFCTCVKTADGGGDCELPECLACLQRIPLLAPSTYNSDAQCGCVTPHIYYNDPEALRTWDVSHPSSVVWGAAYSDAGSTPSHRCIFIYPLTLHYPLTQTHSDTIAATHALLSKLDQLETVGVVAAEAGAAVGQNHPTVVTDDDTAYYAPNQPPTGVPISSKSTYATNPHTLAHPLASRTHSRAKNDFSDAKIKTKFTHHLTSATSTPEAVEKLSDLELMIQIQAGYVRYCKAR